MGIKVKLEDVRIAFCETVLGAQKDYQNNGVFRSSATFLLPKGGAMDKRVDAAIKAAAEEKFGKKAAAILESLKGNSNKYCYQNGDLKEYDGFSGMMALASHRKQSDGRPLVVDQKKLPVTEDNGRLFAGMYVNATVEIYAQDGQNSGIRCGLTAIQLLRDGDSFGGASAPNADAFDSIEAGADAEDLA